MALCISNAAAIVPVSSELSHNKSSSRTSQKRQALASCRVLRGANSAHLKLNETSLRSDSLRTARKAPSVGRCRRGTSVTSAALAEAEAAFAPVAEGDIILEVKGLCACIAESGKEILKGVDLVIRAGEVHAIMGKNGSGKSTLSKVLVGHPDYDVTGGTAVYKGRDLFELEPEERSHAGLFLSFQSPVEVPGVSNTDFLQMACNARRAALGLPELDPLEVLEAEMAILDEIDSGLDVDALRDVSAAVNGLRQPTRAVLMITHYQRLLDYIKPQFVHIMESGKIVKTGDSSLALELEAGGYAAVRG
eukprot:jgi/Mesen1/8851/ME000053S08269